MDHGSSDDLDMARRDRTQGWEKKGLSSWEVQKSGKVSRRHISNCGERQHTTYQRMRGWGEEVYMELQKGLKTKVCWRPGREAGRGSVKTEST